MRVKNFFILTWKKTTMLLLIWIIAVFFHNLISGLTGVEEPVFFIMAVFIIPLYFLISLVYTLTKKAKRK